MSRQELLAVPAGNELCNLRGDEASELRALPLDRFDKAGVRDRDRRLVSEGLDERDVFVGEGLWFTAHEDDDADELVLDHDRDPDRRSVVLPRTAIGVLRVVPDIRDVDRLTGDRGPAGGRRSVESMRMLSVVLSTLCLGVVRRHVQEALLEEVERAVIGLAEPFAGLDHLVEDRLDPCAAGNSAKDIADRVLLLPEVF